MSLIETPERARKCQICQIAVSKYCVGIGQDGLFDIDDLKIMDFFFKCMFYG